MYEQLKINPISLERIDPRGNNEAMSELAKTYAEVFAGPPWNEYTQCKESGKFFGKNTQPNTLCPDGDGNLVLAYPIEDTISYIDKEISQPNSVMFVGYDKNGIVAFTWGYSYSVDKFVKEKYRSAEMQDKTAQLLKQYGIDDNFFYFSESGIVDEYRGRGMSNDFFKKRLEFAKKLNTPIVQRTNCESPMVAVCNKFGFVQIMGPNVEVDKIDRRIKRLPGFVNDICDTEIGDRVLFLLK